MGVRVKRQLSSTLGQWIFRKQLLKRFPIYFYKFVGFCSFICLGRVYFSVLFFIMLGNSSKCSFCTLIFFLFNLLCNNLVHTLTTNCMQKKKEKEKNRKERDLQDASPKEPLRRESWK